MSAYVRDRVPRSSRLVAAIAVGLLTALGAGCGEAGVTSPALAGRDTVYVVPLFLEAVDSNLCCAQIGDNGGSASDWSLEGVQYDAYGGAWARVGDTVTVHVQSPYYDPVAVPFVIPDTVSRDAFSMHRLYDLFVPVTRNVPTVLHMRWEADLVGPTIQFEIYAPHGLKSTRITWTRVFFQACRDGDVYCDDNYRWFGYGPSWEPDSTDEAVEGWVTLQGTWDGWPSDLPPTGYNQGTAWQAVLTMGIEDDSGHQGHGGCDGASVPSSRVTMHCGSFFQR